MPIKAKQRYKLESNGETIPGVTTITAELGWNKNALVAWANRLGLQGYDARKYVDDKATIGSLAHLLVLSGFTKKELDLKDYTANQIESAKNCLASYNEWARKRIIVPIIVEQPLIHEELKFGGTPDFYGTVDGRLLLLDYKTGSSIYAEYIIQTSAYRELLISHGYRVEDVRILKIPRGAEESFMEKPITEEQLKAGWKIFKNCLEIYGTKHALKID